MSPWLVIIFFAVPLFFGVPIAYAIGISALIPLLITDFLPESLVVQQFFTSGNNFPLLAVPFFVLSGEIMVSGGLSETLVNFARSIFGGVRGSLGLITIFTCAIFAALSGSAPATVAAIGGILIPYMVKDKYPLPVAASIAATGGTLGPIIPPSIPFIMYGIVAGVSITDLFLAGILPGLLIMISLMISVYIICRKKGYGIVVTQKLSLKTIIRSTWDAKWALLMPIIILGGIYSGVFTPTEAAIIACAYGLMVGILNRQIGLKNLYGMFSKTCLTIGTAVVLIGPAMAFGQLITLLKVPVQLTNWMSGMTDNVYVVLFILNIFLLVVGMLMETLSAIIILSPLLLAIVTPYGIDPVHMGIIICCNLAVGFCTPPVGVNLFIASSIAGIKLEQMLSIIIKLVLVMIVDVLLITYIPWFSTFLINVF